MGMGINIGMWINVGNAQQGSKLNLLLRSLQDGDSFDNGKIVIQFDDGWGSNYDYGLPLFVSKGVPMTVWLIGNKVGTVDTGDYSGFDYLTWQEIQEMQAAGMDMQTHGYTGNILTALTDKQIADEYLNSDIAFTANNITLPKHTSYSVGRFNGRTMKVTDDYMNTGRSTGWGYTNRKSSRMMLTGGELQTNFATQQARMDYVKENKLCLILWGHMIGVDNGLSISVSDMEAIIDYGKQIGLDFLTMSQLYERMFYQDIRAERITGDTQIDITCKNKFQDSHSISLERSDDMGNTYSEITTLNPGVKDYQDTGLDANKTYFYRARGFVGSKYYPYSREDYVSTAITLTISATGDGSGVGDLKFTSEEEMVLELDGNAKFYTDAAGTQGESSTWTTTSKTQHLYIKCSSGTSNLKISANKFDTIESWTSGTNAPSLGGDITYLWTTSKIAMLGNNTFFGDVSKLINSTTIHVDGNNTLSGDLSGLTQLKSIFVRGSNTITGSLTNLVNLTFARIEGSNTVSGDITNITGIKYLNIKGSNTITGDISDKTSLYYISVSGSNTLYGSIEALSLLTTINIIGLNTVSGDLGLNSGLKNITYLALLGKNQIVDYTSGATWGNAVVQINPDTGYGLSATEIDSMLIDMANSGNMSGKTITLQGANAARTSASDAAVSTLEAAGCTVNTN